MHCDSCPVAAGLRCMAEVAPNVCVMVREGHPLWPAKLIRITNAGDPFDFENNPELRVEGQQFSSSTSDEDVHEAMRTCPDGGYSAGALEVSAADRSTCGCGQADLYPCRAGRGHPVPERTTLANCYQCRAAFLAGSLT